MMKNFICAFLVVVVLGTCSASAEINRCEGVKDGVFLADLIDCSRYFTCWGEKAYPGQCGNDFLFSAKTQRCDVPEKTECVPKCNSTLKFFSYEKTCNKFVICFNGVPVLQVCLGNLQFNKDTDRCDYPKNVDCVENMCTGVDDPADITFLPSHADCGTYYICYGGSAVGEKCSPGLYFNPQMKGCDFKEKVNCTISAKSRNILPYAKMPPTKANITCPKKGVHFYPSPSDPAAYFFCSNGKGIVLTCTPGLVYDKIKQTCREPKDIK